MLNRIQIMKIHALLAAFIFPVACMFMITGALYTWGITGGYNINSYDITLDKPLQSEKATLIHLAESELKKLNLSNPSGNAKIKTAGEHFMLEWTGSKKDITLEPTTNPLTAKLTVKHTSWHRNFVQLHKGKGGVLFKIYAVVFAMALLLLLVSGFIMAWQTPKLKKLTALTMLFGLASFIVLVLLS